MMHIVGASAGSVIMRYLKEDGKTIETFAGIFAKRNFGSRFFKL